MSYTVRLSHSANPDIRGGYYQDAGRPKVRDVEVKTLADASKKCLSYIDRNKLGGGNWSGGQVFKDGAQVAKVSYNGRIWAMDGAEIA